VYMGFEIIGVNESSTLYLVRLYEHLLYIVNATNSTKTNNIDVIINYLQMENFYYSLMPMVKVEKPLQESVVGNKFFSVKDCNGNTLCFSSRII
jgi:hypothetical protein